ncbi:MAG: TonB family protein, partial [Hyphomicrobiales bacterium]|nr:TonB family protein [Hyphomicrobiales bacterium]
YHAIKSYALQKLARRNSESIFWNFSGSTMIHILIILGLGFYISLPAPSPSAPKHTISINLRTVSELSAETQIGEGKQMEKEASQPAERKQKQIIHTDEGTTPFDSGAFLIAQQHLMQEIKENNVAIEETERIGFLGVYDVHPAYRQYQQYWQNYVSEFGTENYPRGLLDKGLSGTLELDIAIDKNGVVRSTDIHRSSGNHEIDNAAIEIAMLASPYDPLPVDMAKDIDVLHIIRTWDFNNNTLTSRAKE